MCEGKWWRKSNEMWSKGKRKSSGRRWGSGRDEINFTACSFLRAPSWRWPAWNVDPKPEVRCTEGRVCHAASASILLWIPSAEFGNWSLSVMWYKMLHCAVFEMSCTFTTGWSPICNMLLTLFGYPGAFLPLLRFFYPEWGFSTLTVVLLPWMRLFYPDWDFSTMTGFYTLTEGFLLWLRLFYPDWGFSTLTEVFLLWSFSNLTEVFLTWLRFYLLWQVFLPWLRAFYPDCGFSTLTEVFLPWLRFPTMNEVFLPWLRFL